MRRLNQIREEINYDDPKSFQKDFADRIDLNVLLSKRENEKKLEKKNNLLILSGTLAVVGVIIVILTL